MSKTKKISSRKWDASVVIAVVAVFISSISIFISIRETGILSEQQELMASQQEASAWPYLENNVDNVFRDDTMAIFKLEITNKGVGPAILGEEVQFSFDQEPMNQWELYQVLRDKYPILKVTQTQMASIGGKVLAPGEKHIAITEQITVPANNGATLRRIVDEINDLYSVQYCYCSVYGRCWQVKSLTEIERSSECTFRAAIR